MVMLTDLGSERFRTIQSSDLHVRRRLLQWTNNAHNPRSNLRTYDPDPLL